jgi:hypothetical protein
MLGWAEGVAKPYFGLVASTRERRGKSSGSRERSILSRPRGSWQRAEGGTPIPGTGDALRRTSDALLRDIEALLQLEEEKRSIEPGDPKLVDLASRIELVAERVLASSTNQRAQTQLIHELTENGSPAAPEKPIEDTPRSMEAILAAWRQAERQLEAADPGSAEAREAELLVDQLREEYRRAHDEATRPDR